MRVSDFLALASSAGWTLDPAVVILLAGSAWLYVRGLKRLWRRSGPGQGVTVWQARAFVVGWASLAVALVSPLHEMGETLFSAHMVQHELLMLVAAPLCVLGRPLSTFLWAFPAGGRQWLGAASRLRPLQRLWGSVTRPLPAFLIQSAALWIWHLPSLYEASLRSPAVHAAQHASFFAASAIFWWAVIHGRFGRQGYGVSAAAVFGVALEGGVLGALIAFASSLWYPAYEWRTAAWGISPVEDQQLAGIIMWVPSGFLLVGFGLGLFAAWLGEAQRRVAWAEERRAAEIGDARPGGHPARKATISAAVCLALSSLLLQCAGCEETASAKAARMTGGKPDLGRTAIRRYGCGSCHEIQGVPGARGLVGPPLQKLAKRVYIAGHITNDPAHLSAWIRDPQHLHPPNAMPNAGVTESDARNIVAYLYSLK
jgi:putative membrane protein